MSAEISQKLHPYQEEVRQMLVIDALAKVDLLTPEEIQQIEEMGLRFESRPEQAPDIFFVYSVCPQEPHATQKKR